MKIVTGKWFIWFIFGRYNHIIQIVNTKQTNKLIYYNYERID